MKLKTVTLGCKVNQYETEFVREGLLSIGFQDAAEHDPADLCIVNTCTVTAEGDSKSRQVIRKLARENPASKIVVMGCYATREPQEVAGLPNVTEVGQTRAAGPARPLRRY
jgi:threonylcarbamoyladenosine tRNA methylthiotransferase MtaB